MQIDGVERESNRTGQLDGALAPVLVRSRIEKHHALARLLSLHYVRGTDPKRFSHLLVLRVDGGRVR
jgi:hypothetical protein